MKRLFLALLLLLFLCTFALADGTAQDITKQCTFTYAPRSTDRSTMQDSSYLTYYTGSWLEVTTPVPCHGLYVSFAGREAPYLVQTLNEQGAWETLLQDERCYANSYVELPGVTHIRLMLESREDIKIAEIHLFGEGEKPAWVQDWQPFEGKADLLVLSAHGDDELLFFGGIIPYYTAERQMNVIVCYLTDQTSCRRNELLDGLWTCGVRAYPSMGVFKDIKNNSLGDSYGFWGEKPVVEYITSLYQKYQPEVVLTHDLKGEYGHGAHRVCADASIKAINKANQGENPWQVKKLYLHLYKENAITFDWRQPLAAFDGQTAFDVAAAAFKCHQSQQSNGLRVEDSGSYACNRFGLYYSTVGYDHAQADLFTNVPGY
jgi:LmbE family N-acetylglucosaminyl deacetylase